MGKRRADRFVLCVSNRGYRASLVVRRVYRQIPDREAEARDLVRVIDESGEDYLFPANLFFPIDLPSALEERLAEVI